MESVAEENGHSDAGALAEESLVKIAALHKQFERPSAYILRRMQTHSLEEIKRELISLQDAAKTHSSALIRTFFLHAKTFDDDIHSGLKRIHPLKDKVSLAIGRLYELESTQSIESELVNKLDKYALVSYAKLALDAIIQAMVQLDFICEVVVDNFKSYRTGMPNSNVYDDAVAIIEVIAANMQEMYATGSGAHPSSGIEWSFFELLPNELVNVQVLLNKCREYEHKLVQLLHVVSAKARDGDPTCKEWQDAATDVNARNAVEYILSTMQLLNEDELKQFAGEYCPAHVQRKVDVIKKKLFTLVDCCATCALTNLYRLYVLPYLSSRSKRETNFDHEEWCEALASVIKCGNGFRRHGYQDQTARLFGDVFFKPIFSATLTGESSCFTLNLTPHDEVVNFKKFIELIETKLLSADGILMKFLNFVTNLLGSNSFKTNCIQDIIAPVVFQHIQNYFASISHPIYPEYYLANYNLYARLLTVLETSNGDCYDSYLKWRGSQIPYEFSCTFNTAAIIEGYVNEIKSTALAALEQMVEIDGTAHYCLDRGKDIVFYNPLSASTYNAVVKLLSPSHFFYHLMPDYLRAIVQLLKQYTVHMDKLFVGIESAGSESHATLGSGFSFSYAAYALHDVDVFVRLLRVGDFSMVKLVEGLPNLIDDQSQLAVAGFDLNASQPNVAVSLDYGETFGSLVTSLLRLLEFPLVACMYKLSANVKGGTNTERLELLSHLWSCIVARRLGANSNTEDADADADALVQLPKWACESDDVYRLADFACLSMLEVCQVYSALYEDLDAIKDKLKQYIVEKLFCNVQCGFQFVQSLPSKFRRAAGTSTCPQAQTQTVVPAPAKPSPYVRLLLVPLLSFYEYCETILDPELLGDVVGASVSLVCNEYGKQVTTMLKTVQAVNATLTRGQAGGILQADVDLLSKQLDLDISEFTRVCRERLGVDSEATRVSCDALGSLRALVTKCENKWETQIRGGLFFNALIAQKGDF